jgi:chemotaxis protein methyltransferase CheR
VQPAVYKRFRRVVYDATGINLGPSKDTLVAARVGKRMRALGLTSYRAYLERVADDATGEEMRQLVDAICTNVTSFFREEDHFAYVREVVLARLREGETRIRLWSAACSTGEEVYSLAIALADIAEAWPSADIRILGTDLSTKALRVALDATYPAARVEPVLPALRSRYFAKHGRGTDAAYTVRPDVRRLTTFRQVNLARPPYALKGPLDVVMCRNVMIYFDQPVRERLLDEVRRLLRPGGHLLVGHAESLNGTSGFAAACPSTYVRI